ncbi:MAG: hypothetical protein ACJ0KI_01385 [Dehalococcoidia bacterium]|tara:strand:- start:203 stop:688 length:486 start_codon:yes stop_codon:yes gene_type:complete
MTLNLQNNNYISILDAFIHTIKAIISKPYCDLDKPLGKDGWSLRQHIYHLIDTPIGGLHTGLEQAMSIPDFILEIIPDLDNLNEERRVFNHIEILKDLDNYSYAFHKVLASYNQSKLDTIIIETSFPKRGFKEDRSARTLLDRLFVRHWSEHLYDMTNLNN